jgi:hypothetical protein
MRKPAKSLRPKAKSKYSYKPQATSCKQIQKLLLSAFGFWLSPENSQKRKSLERRRLLPHLLPGFLIGRFSQL